MYMTMTMKAPSFQIDLRLQANDLTVQEVLKRKINLTRNIAKIDAKTTKTKVVGRVDDDKKEAVPKKNFISISKSWAGM